MNGGGVWTGEEGMKLGGHGRRGNYLADGWLLSIPVAEYSLSCLDNGLSSPISEPCKPLHTQPALKVGHVPTTHSNACSCPHEAFVGPFRTV